MKIIYKFFDKTEDHVRAWFSRRPILYAFIGGIGVVLFWRGVWHSADMIMDYFFPVIPVHMTPEFTGGWPWWDGPLSMLIGGVILLITGVFVAEFIGSEIIISGLRREKKLADRTENEIKREAQDINTVKKEVEIIAKKVSKLNNTRKTKKG